MSRRSSIFVSYLFLGLLVINAQNFSSSAFNLFSISSHSFAISICLILRSSSAKSLKLSSDRNKALTSSAFVKGIFPKFSRSNRLLLTSDEFTSYQMILEFSKNFILNELLFFLYDFIQLHIV